MRAIERIINTIEYSIDNSLYEPVERDGIWLGSAEKGQQWVDIAKTICAYLNSDGGGLVLGIADTGNEYLLKGPPDRLAEEIRYLSSQILGTGGEPLALEEYLNVEMRPFKEKALALLYVDALLEEDRYCTWQGQAYTFVKGEATPLDRERLKAHRAYQETAHTARELDLVPEASLADLSLEYVNRYRERLGVSPFEVLGDAVLFLERGMFAANEIPTFLGIFFFAVDPHKFLGESCLIHFSFEIKNKIKRKKDKQAHRTIKDTIAIRDYIFNQEEFENKIKTIDKSSNFDSFFPVLTGMLIHRSPFSQIGVRASWTETEFTISTSNIYQENELIAIKNKQTFLVTPKEKPYSPYQKTIASITTETKLLETNDLGNLALNNKIDIPHFEIKNEATTLTIDATKLIDAQIGLNLKAYSQIIENKNEGKSLSWQEKAILAYLIKSDQQNEKSNFVFKLNIPDDSFEAALSDLKSKKLIEKQKKPSSKNEPLAYGKNLFQFKHKEKLEKLYALPYDEIPALYRSVLNLLYTFTHFSSTPALSTKQIAYNLQILTGKGGITKMDEEYLKEIAKIVGRLAKRKMVIRDKNKTGYLINTGYKIPETLFQL